MSFEVSQPILNPPFAEPSRYWYIREGETPQLLDGLCARQGSSCAIPAANDC